MSLASAQAQIDRAAPDAHVALETGDYGPLVIRGPITLDVGGSTFWGDGRAPAISIRAPGVKIVNANLRPSPEWGLDGWPIVLEASAGADPELHNVRLAGHVCGLAAEDGPWRLPTQIELGLLTAEATFFAMELSVPVPCRLVCRIAGITLDPPAVAPGINKVLLKVSDVSKDCILLGRLELHTDRLVRLIPLHGRVALSRLGAAPGILDLGSLSAEEREIFLRELHPPSPPAPVEEPPVRSVITLPPAAAEQDAPAGVELPAPAPTPAAEVLEPAPQPRELTARVTPPASVAGSSFISNGPRDAVSDPVLGALFRPAAQGSTSADAAKPAPTESATPASLISELFTDPES